MSKHRQNLMQRNWTNEELKLLGLKDFSLDSDIEFERLEKNLKDIGFEFIEVKGVFPDSNNQLLSIVIDPVK